METDRADVSSLYSAGGLLTASRSVQPLAGWLVVGLSAGAFAGGVR